MRLIATADLHFNHPRSRKIAIELIERMNHAGGDVLLLVGDTAVLDGDSLEQCLDMFRFAGPKLFVAGNHELWTRGADSHAGYMTDLPRRIRSLGWHWLEDTPFVADDVAIVGSVGWYDYSFAQPSLEIPRRFYARKISPGAAERFSEFADLFEPNDISQTARNVIARWNDGRHIKLGRSDEQFLDELLTRLHQHLTAVAMNRKTVAAIHHLPFHELLPPPSNAQWDFAKAFLGSEKIGRALLDYPNVSHVLCGHSHMPIRKRVGHIEAINIGSSYRHKAFATLDL